MTAIADASGDASALWGWSVWALIAILVAAIYAIWRILDSKQPFPTPNAAQAPVKQEQPPVRAHAPALRVHLCTRLCGRPVARPGESCYPRCESPVHEAERILRQDGAA